MAWAMLLDEIVGEPTARLLLHSSGFKVTATIQQI